jgi:1A family penicillin-binding protein
VPGVSRTFPLIAALAFATALPLAAQTERVVQIVRPPLATVVLDRNGGLLAEIGPEARTWVRLVDLPSWLGQAFVATEDRRFYLHDGVDMVGVLGAVRDNILHGFGSRGASTITQQLIGAMGYVDRSDISPGRKLREWDYARQLERRHTKAEILEAYINWINFGNAWYGVEAASRHYFGKSARDVTLAEAAVLAALPQSPVHFDPRTNPAAAVRRRNLVLQRMEEQRYITAAQRRAAAATPLRVVPDNGFSVRAPYVVEWVRQWLVDRYGIATVNNGGLTVVTTVDPALQAAANRALALGLARTESIPGYRWPRYGAATAPVRAGRTPYLQGLLVALDPRSGDVLALVGGRDYRDSEFNRAVQGLRQAGSAFKPFVYAAALEAGMLPSDLIDDSPLDLPRGDGTRWRPENSDGTFSGPVTLRSALARSINVPAVRTAQSVGIDSVISVARRMGITTPIPPFLATSIGAADVRPIELIASFSAFANLGTWTPPRVITVVQDQHGLPIWEPLPVVPVQVLDSGVAFRITSILQEAVERGTGVSARRYGPPADLPIAGKTGTTNDNADVWFVGYTPNLVAGVWLGFDQRQGIARGAFGGTLAAPVWSLFAREAYRRLPVPPPWTPPEGLVAARVRRDDGRYAPGDTSAATVTEWFVAGTEPTREGIGQRLLRRLRSFGLIR